MQFVSVRMEGEGGRGEGEEEEEGEGGGGGEGGCLRGAMCVAPDSRRAW